MTNEELAAELERLNEKATQGPWKAGRPDMLSAAVLSDGEVGEMGKYVYRQMDAPVDDPMFGAFHIPEPNSIEDAQLIVFYRAHHAAIVSALRDVARMRAELDGGMFVPISEWNITIAERDALKAALQPFADACARADASSEEVRRAGMGHGHSDDASPGWGIRYRHLKAARSALEPAR